MSLTLSANGHRMEIPAGAAVNNLAAVSWCGWVYATNRTNAHRIVAKEDDLSSSARWVFSVSGTAGEVLWAWARSGGTDVYITNDAPLEANKWVYLAICAAQSGPSVLVYKGTLTAAPTLRTFGTSSPSTGTYNDDSARPVVIGNNTGITPTSYFEGAMGPNHLIGRQITANEVLQQWMDMRPIANTIAVLYPGDSGTTTVVDASGNGNNATITGTALSDNVPLRRRWGRRASGAVAAPAGDGSVTVNLTGQSMTAAQGSPTVSAATAVTLTGQSIAAAQGAPVVRTIYTPTTFADSFTPINETSYYYTSAFARVVFDTSATSVIVTHQRTLSATYDTQAGIGVLVDGVYNQTIAAATQGVSSTTISLPPGAKRVTFVNGVQSRPSGIPPEGTYLVSVAFVGSATPVTLTGTTGVLFIGDSIVVGFKASAVPNRAMPMQVRAALSRSVAVDGYGGNRLSYFAIDTTALNASVQRVQEIALDYSEIYLALGTNDYTNNTMSAATFATRLAATFVALHTAFPNARILAQTPMLTSGYGSTPNSFTNTLADYRTAYYTAATGLPYVEVQDGTTIITTAELDPDGVHLTSAGCDVYSAFVIDRLNDIRPTGQAMAAAQGTIGVTAGCTVALTGQAMAAAQGAPSVTTGAAVTVNLSGQSMTATQGTVTAQAGAGASLTGQPMGSAAGSLTVEAGCSVTLAGQSMAAAPGAIAATANCSVTLTGQGIAASQGSPAPAVGAYATITGQSLAMAQGGITTAVGIPASTSYTLSNIRIGSYYRSTRRS